ALSAGIQAVVSAMSGEVRFTNENEVAFAKLRLGCRHGGAHGGAALRQVQPQQQAVVVSFLARMAGRRRRCAARRVQELGCILAKASASWQELLAKEEPLGGPSGLLAEELKALATGQAEPERQIENEARVFLREKQTQRYLSIVSSPNGHGLVAMTDVPVSLFVCHLDGKGTDSFASSSTEACEESLKTRLSELEETLDIGFAHEGIPSFGGFLCSRRRILADVELSCSSKSFGKRERFRWGPDASLQHQFTEMWLSVDLASPQKVFLSAERSERGAWEAVAAL
ncbi:unnamed protein product, partial [Effrenium voratum]